MIDSEKQDYVFMQEALNQAKLAFEADEVPVGAVIVIENKIVTKAHNQTQLLKDVTAHAEILAITAACNLLQIKYLPTATLYVSLEPCLMCAGALFWNKIGRIVYAANDEKNGFSKYTFSKSPFHPKTIVHKGMLATESAALLKQFFINKR